MGRLSRPHNLRAQISQVTCSWKVEGAHRKTREKRRGETVTELETLVSEKKLRLHVAPLHGASEGARLGYRDGCSGEHSVESVSEVMRCGLAGVAVVVHPAVVA